MPLVAALILAPAPLAPAPLAAPVQFPLGNRVLIGRGAGKCVIERRWRDGRRLRYRAWDACRRMSVRTVARTELRDVTALGNRTTRLAGIPRRTEPIGIANGSSAIVLFRDRAGRQRETPISD